MDRYVVISSDGHAGPRPEVYREYLDPKYREEFDVQHKARMEMLAKAGERLEMRQESKKWAEGKSHGLSGAWDSDRRNEILDADGVAAEILFVDGLTEENSPPFGGDLGLMPMGADPELQWGARITGGCPSSFRWSRVDVLGSRWCHLSGASTTRSRKCIGQARMVSAESCFLISG
jgi:hypothetical protein